MKPNANQEKNHQNPQDLKVSQKDDSVTLSKQEYDELSKAAGQKDEYWDKLLRQQAEFDNIRKRQEKERNEFIKYANENLIVQLLEVLDNLERLVSMAEEHKQDFESFLKGVEIILAHLYELLKKYGVKPIETKDKMFDPLYHEALMTVESDSAKENKIIEELQKGYILDNRVIRTSKVKVAKKKTEETKEEKI
jgi:molecular chaperone GrpE